MKPHLLTKVTYSFTEKEKLKQQIISVISFKTNKLREKYTVRVVVSLLVKMNRILCRVWSVDAVFIDLNIAMEKKELWALLKTSLWSSSRLNGCRRNEFLVLLALWNLKKYVNKKQLGWSEKKWFIACHEHFGTLQKIFLFKSEIMLN